MARIDSWALAHRRIAGLADGPLFRQGFGDPDRIDAVVRAVRAYDVTTRPLPLVVTSARSCLSAIGLRILQLTFRSPGACFLPDECQLVRVEMLLPPREDEPPPLCLMLPATAEETFAVRRWLAVPLLRRGIGAAIVETPFYGRRRATGQLGPLIRTVADQFGLNFATVEETRALLYWLRSEGYTRLGVTGYSQGGVMAAFAASVTRFPLAAVPRAAPVSAAELVLEGPVHRAICWGRLAADCGGLEAAERYLCALLEPMTVEAFPPPVEAGSAVVMAARDDRLVPPGHGEILHRHWPGSELRWLEGGHLTALLRAREQAEAIADAFDRLSSPKRGLTQDSPGIEKAD
jgi:pimeloyl-ACP methyl ester carboxylesterase